MGSEDRCDGEVAVADEDVAGEEEKDDDKVIGS